MLLVMPRAGLSSTIAQKCFVSPFELGGRLMSVLPMSGFCFFLFHPSTWGHSPKDIEHVKNSCNIYKAKYIQWVKKKNNKKVYMAKKKYMPILR